MDPQSKDNMKSCNVNDIHDDSIFTLPTTSTAVEMPTIADGQLIKKLEVGLKFLEPVIYRPHILKNFLGLGFAASATSIGNSKSMNSADDYAATSRAMVTVSRHLNDILGEAPPHTRNDLGFMLYRRKLDDIPLCRLKGSEVKPFKGSHEWQLIETAAYSSSQVYHPQSENGILVPAKGDIKPSTVCYKKINGGGLLVVAIRGSITLDDWLKNFNGAPQPWTELLEGNIEWHTGFMKSAIAMEEQITEAISSLKSKKENIETILFTGHSAGGAIAQMFYAMSFSRNTRLSKVVADLDNIHCITFGTPPVATTPIYSFTDSSLFLSIINEGDPVTLAQEEYLKTLISVYVMSAEQFAMKYPNGLLVPSPRLRVSGTCVVLRDKDQDDPDEEGIDAVEVAAENVEKKLFGNPLVHLMHVYLSRVEQLVRGLSNSKENGDGPCMA